MLSRCRNANFCGETRWGLGCVLWWALTSWCALAATLLYCSHDWNCKWKHILFFYNSNCNRISLMYFPIIGKSCQSSPWLCWRLGDLLFIRKKLHKCNWHASGPWPKRPPRASLRQYFGFSWSILSYSIIIFSCECSRKHRRGPWTIRWRYQNGIVVLLVQSEYMSRNKKLLVRSEVSIPTVRKLTLYDSSALAHSHASQINGTLLYKKATGVYCVLVTTLFCE